MIRYCGAGSDLKDMKHAQEILDKLGLTLARSVEISSVKKSLVEIEAAERYEDLADQMVICNNEIVSELFRRMSELETLHVEKIRDRIGALEVSLPGAS